MKNNIENIYPLTPLQKGILYHKITDEGSNAYFEQMEFEIEGYLNISHMEQALNHVIDKYEILRTNFIYKETREPKQVVLNGKKGNLIYTDLCTVSKTRVQLENEIKDYKIFDRKQGFDLMKDCLIRMSIFKLDIDIYRMILSFQHIILDGWSIGIFFKELLAGYKLLACGGELEENKNNDFSGYANWLNRVDKTDAEDYWKDYINEYDHKIKIGEILGGSRQRTYIPETIQIELGKNLTSLVYEAAKKMKVPPNTVYETAWAILLSNFNNTDDVVFGKVVSGRNINYSNIQNIMGLFINTIPKRVRYNDAMSIEELIMNVSRSNYQSSEFEYLELSRIQNYSELKKDLVNHIFVYENYPIDNALSEMEDSAIKFRIKYLDSFEQTNYDLAVIIAPSDNASVILRYNAQVFERSFIESITRYYINCISKMIENPGKKIVSLDPIPDKDREMILNVFNNTKTDYPSNQSLYEIFENRAINNPKRLALKYEEESLSYQELLEEAKVCAAVLTENNVSKGDRVGLLMDNSIQMICTILGILKIGASYVPIDTKLPKERIKYIIDDSHIVVLVEREKISRYKEAENNDILPFSVNGAAEACVIYTSGTTGNPKGTGISNRNISRVVLNTNYLEINCDDIILQTANYSFDGSLFNIFGALLNGAALVMIDRETMLDMNKLSKVIVSEKITLFFMTTSLFNVMVTTIGEALKEVRCIVIGGETASAKHCKKALESMKKGIVINGYGPTESTVFATAYVMRNIKDTSGVIPIGKVLTNTFVYIVNHHDHLQLPGIEGEIYIAGDGITNGYLNNEELTKQKFTEDPFNNGILYKTGDIGRWTSEGTIEYCGRKDSQVKIRGYRVEPEELENHVRKNKKLKEIAIIAIENDLNMKELVLFYTADEQVNKNELRSQLQKIVPYYMIPKYFIQLSEFKLNKNGKIDKENLGKYDISITTSDEVNYKVRELNSTEQKVMDIWKNVLMLEQIKPEDDFYEIGGDSIKAILIYSQLQKAGFQLSMKDIIEYSTITRLSDRLDRMSEDGQSDGESKITLINEEKKQKIILFPAFLPGFANQIMGKLLMEHIKDYSIYIAEFFETDNLYSAYADMLGEVIQPEDKIVLMGYSFGGNIAYEVAKELEGRGIIVRHIVFIDSYRLNKFWFADPSDLKVEVDKFFDEYVPMDKGMNLEEFHNDMFRQMSTYCNFINNYEGIYPEIEASMYMILSSEEVADIDVRLQWEYSTRNQYKMYQGYGTHMEMWRNEFLPKNLELLVTILNTI